MHDDDWFTFAELASRLGSLTWVEQQLGELLCAWSAIEEAPANSTALFTIGRHHQWHAEVLEGCLPTSPQLHEAALVVAPTQGWSDAVQRLRELVHPAATSARLRSLTRVLNPWVVRETDTLLELARPISDAAITRWLRFLRIDHHNDGRVLEQLAAATETNTVRFEDHVLLNELDLTR